MSAADDLWFKNETAYAGLFAYISKGRPIDFGIIELEAEYDLWRMDGLAGAHLPDINMSADIWDGKCQGSVSMYHDENEASDCHNQLPLAFLNIVRGVKENTPMLHLIVPARKFHYEMILEKIGASLSANGKPSINVTLNKSINFDAAYDKLKSDEFVSELPVDRVSIAMRFGV